MHVNTLGAHRSGTVCVDTSRISLLKYINKIILAHILKTKVV